MTATLPIVVKINKMRKITSINRGSSYLFFIFLAFCFLASFFLNFAWDGRREGSSCCWSLLLCSPRGANLITFFNILCVALIATKTRDTLQLFSFLAPFFLLHWSLPCFLPAVFLWCKSFIVMVLASCSSVIEVLNFHIQWTVTCEILENYTAPFLVVVGRPFLMKKGENGGGPDVLRGVVLLTYCIANHVFSSFRRCFCCGSFRWWLRHSTGLLP